MRTDQLEYLEEIARVNSMNKASKNLCISVQALSASMKNLEDELGFQVLDTTYKGTQLTDKGEILLDAGLRFLDTIYELQGGCPERRVIRGTLPIYCVPGVIDVVLPDFMMQFQKYHPQAELEAVPVYYQNVFGGLLDGDFDYTFVFAPMVNDESLINWEERFEFVPLKRLDFYCEINNKLPVAAQKTISIKTMLDYEIVTWEPSEYHLFSSKEIFWRFNAEKEIRTVKHYKLFEKMLSERPVLTLTASLKNIFADKKNIMYIPLSDKNIWAVFGYVKLNQEKLCQQSQWVVEMMKEFLDVI